MSHIWYIYPVVIGMLVNSNFRERLILLRKKAKLTQQQLADLSGYSRQSFVRWETGRTTPTIDDLQKIAVYLNTTLEYLVNGTEEQIEKPNVRLGTKFIEIPLLTMATAASCGAGNGLYGVTPESTENIFVEASTFKCLDETRKPFGVPIEGDSMVGAGLEEGADAVINLLKR